jgi:hypothetical protein
MPATAFEKGRTCEHSRDDRRQKLFDLDGFVDRGIDGVAARALRQLKNCGSQDLAVRMGGA